LASNFQAQKTHLFPWSPFRRSAVILRNCHICSEIMHLIRR
jgi:hypothetical protein